MTLKYATRNSSKNIQINIDEEGTVVLVGVSDIRYSMPFKDAKQFSTDLKDLLEVWEASNVRR